MRFVSHCFQELRQATLFVFIRQQNSPIDESKRDCEYLCVTFNVASSSSEDGADLDVWSGNFALLGTEGAWVRFVICDKKLPPSHRGGLGRRRRWRSSFVNDGCKRPLFLGKSGRRLFLVAAGLSQQQPLEREVLYATRRSSAVFKPSAGWHSEGG